jgi:hypothetical protein
MNVARVKARKSSKGIKSAIFSKINWLFETEEGKEKLAEFLLYISSGATPSCACLVIDIHPTTFKNWIVRGYDEPDGYYGSFRTKVLSAIAEARTSAEIVVKETDPKWWLTRGPGKILGDHYNETITKLPPNVSHNIDGTISDKPNKTSVHIESSNNDAQLIEDKQTDRQDKINQTVMLEALKELRKSGVDLNSLVDSSP